MRCRLKRSLESSVYLSSERLDGITKEGVIMRGTWLNTTLLAGLIPNLGSDFLWRCVFISCTIFGHSLEHTYLVA